MRPLHRAAVSALFIVSVSAAISAFAAPAAPLLKPGVWEITTNNEMAGSGGSRKVVSRECFSADDVTDVQKLLPRQHEFGMQCQNRELKVQPTGANWQLACTGKNGSLTGAAKLSVAGGGYIGQAALEQNKPGTKPVRVMQSYSGKWIESCK